MKKKKNQKKIAKVWVTVRVDKKNISITVLFCLVLSSAPVNSIKTHVQIPAPMDGVRELFYLNLSVVMYKMDMMISSLNYEGN